MTLLNTEYHEWVVALSFIIAALASYVALNLASKISRSTGRTRIVWLLTGSCVMGSGVWSMHFVGMLAFHMDASVRYDIPITILSALASIVASLIAFRVTLDTKVNKWRLSLGGLFMGSGIVAMHYTGMAAMRTSATISYNPYLWTLSALIALVTSYTALYLLRKFRNSPDFSRWKLYCSIIMGAAICGMHYTGMAATHFHSHGGILADSSGAAPVIFLLGGVSLATFLILSVSWAAIYFDRNVLERMAYSDSLTGLSNRYGIVRYFEENFLEETEGAILFIDLDRFKAINDTLGHDIGDLLLCEVAKRLQQCIGEKHTVFRLGGDEFLIASTEESEGTIKVLAQRILEDLKKPYIIEENELYVTASIGVSLAPKHGTDRSSLMKAADTAMYQAKASGRNKYSVFDEEMFRKQVRKMGLERDLRKALEHQEFLIEYQPKWDSYNNQMNGMEALLRWNHPQLGIIPPMEFIPIAEETGLIVPITRWVLNEVCKQNQGWIVQKVAEVTVSVNISIRVFESQKIHVMVEEALAISDMEPRFLELEITESVAMNDVEDTIAQLQQLRQMGVLVSLDDFGTGYSSLGNLDEMPVDTLKIDQIFIHKSNLASKKNLIRNIIAIAKDINMKVIAEGVETKEQIEFLQSCGCYVMQGYYYGKPMSPNEITNRFGKSAMSMSQNE